MPYSRQTLPELIQGVQSDIQSRLSGVDPWLPFSDLSILAYVFAGLQYLRFGYLDYISLNAVPVTAQNESLEAWAALKGITRLAAAPVTGSITFSGNPGTVISEFTELVRSDGVAYVIPAGRGGVIGVDGTFTTTATATVGGSNTNLTAGGSVTLFGPIFGVNPTVIVSADFTGGTDQESDDSLRNRMLFSYANPIQGGDLLDYVAWSLLLPQVTRAWSAGPYWFGSGTVTVFFMEDATRVTTNGIPVGSNGASQYEQRLYHATGDQLTLADFLYFKRSATALINVMAPVGVPLNVEVSGIPVDIVIRNNVIEALNSVCLRTASPVGVLKPDRKYGGSVYLSDIEDAFAAVSGVDHFVILEPTNDVVLPNFGEISIPGSVIFV